MFAAGACLFDPRYADYGDVDTAALTLRLDTGALATFDFGRRTAFGQDELIEVFGSEGMLVTGRTRAGDQALYQGEHVIESGLYPSWSDRFAETYVRELDSFVSAITDGTPVHASLARRPQGPGGGRGGDPRDGGKPADPDREDLVTCHHRKLTRAHDQGMISSGRRSAWPTPGDASKPSTCRRNGWWAV